MTRMPFLRMPLAFLLLCGLTTPYGCGNLANAEKLYEWNKEDDSIIFESEEDSDNYFRSSCVGKWRTLPRSTMCVYHDNPAAFSCGVSEEDKRIILSVHNELRGKVSPPQRNMMKMIMNGVMDILFQYWNDDLAAVAQKWAKQCRRAHDTFENREIPGWGSSNLVGQSWASGGLYSSWEKAIRMGWHSEVKDFVYGSQWQRGVVGHYTQLVRDQANLIGCGKCMCPKEGIFDNPMYICNYYKSNSRDTGRPYMSGSPCQDCASGRCNNQGLCDCGDRVCKNNGTLNTRTCQCDCFDRWYGEDCGYFDCPPSDGRNCGPGKFYDPSKCKQWSNVPRICPHMCGLCNGPRPSINPTAPPTANPGGCRDSHARCREWASKGECRANPRWMLENCRLSCNTCVPGITPEKSTTATPTSTVDSKTTTDKPGSPETTVGTKTTEVPKTTVISGCKDSNSYCPRWAASGECTRNRVWMVENCQLSCHSCNTGNCDDNHSNCRPWAVRNECTRNPQWMLKNCRRSCRMCT